MNYSYDKNSQNHNQNLESAHKIQKIAGRKESYHSTTPAAETLRTTYINMAETNSFKSL
jgi:hypothetical protein